MRRAVITAILLGALALVPAFAVLADECPALIRTIHRFADIRFDQRAYDARAKAVEAARLHAEGDHDDAAKVAREGCELLGILGTHHCPPQPTR